MQWRIAALNIDDLKRQDQLKEKWLDDYKNTHQLETNLQASGEWEDLLCTSTMPCVFFNGCMMCLNSDISYMNQLFM